MMRAVVRRIPKPVQEFFLLKELETRQQELGESQGIALRIRYHAASRRLEGARCLRDCGYARASVVLYREAVQFYLLAFLASENEPIEEVPIDPSVVFDKVALAFHARGRSVPAEVSRARELLAREAPFDIDRMTSDEAARRARELDDIVKRVAELVEPRSREQLVATRTLRKVGAAVLLVALLAWGTVSALAPRNLALHKKVAASSHAYDTTPEGAVDGHKYGQLGFHSETESSPWLSIDLGRRYLIQRVKAFGRSDCCYDQSVPLAAEVSDDGVAYRKVAERSEPFTQFEPWVIEPSVAARFVRLRTMRESVLVLSEVEVYGSAAK